MKLNYSNDMLQEINNNIDLLELASNYITLTQKGHDYFGCCPLHVDKTPSFSITPSKNMYYCFSCGKHGGPIGFLMDYVGLSFEDAVKRGAMLANIDLNKMCQSQTFAYLRKVQAAQKHVETKEIIHPTLPEAELSKYKQGKIDEWEEEGIPAEVMDLFGVKIDEWNNRIVYPVRDIHGNLINIKGRTRYPNYKFLKLPKYINYYKIGTMDYFQGLDITLPYVQAKREIIIFESVKSVMKAFAWGYKNCASAEKHTLTDEQIRLLVKLHINIVFAYDSDIKYYQSDVKANIDKLKRVTNVYVIDDVNQLLGGVNAKNAPVDMGRYVWEELYQNKRKIF